MAGKTKIIPNSLKKHRRLMGFSREDIRKHLKLRDTSMISRWECGFAMPSAEHLLKLSVLYKTLVNELYYELSKEYQAELCLDEHKTHREKPDKGVGTFVRGP